jgi:uncharacterized protein
VKYLLDVNALLAAIIANHPHHAAADRWLLKKQLVTCPLSELGFIRVSTNPKAYGYSMALARQALEGFIAAHQTAFIPADLPALDSAPNSSQEVTDTYLAELADRAKMKLATFEANIKHPAIEVIA